MTYAKKLTQESPNMILVRKTAGVSYDVVSGRMRLKAIIQLHGHAEVQDINMGEMLTVHEVGGHLVALTGDSHQSTEEKQAAFEPKRAGKPGSASRLMQARRLKRRG